jgi:hypothetical protein
MLTGIWNQPLHQPCEICGQKRSFTWSMEDFSDTIVDQKYIVVNPLRSFIDWLMNYEFNEESKHDYENLCLSHYGVSCLIRFTFCFCFLFLSIGSIRRDLNLWRNLPYV